MLTALNAEERSGEDWANVVKEAGHDLAILDIKKPAGSTDSVIEIGFANK